jgi:hypothetical protein
MTVTAVAAQLGPPKDEDARFIAEYVKQRAADEFVQARIRENVEGLVPAFDHETFWVELMGCLLSTQQRSTKGSPVDLLLCEVPFTLSLERCRDKEVEAFVLATLTARRGIRRTKTIAKQAAKNYTHLYNGGWGTAQGWFDRLRALRATAPDPSHAVVEREAARWADDAFAGLGPKQARNLWQSLGLTRYEMLLDSRVVDWLKKNLGLQLDSARLSDADYYETVLDHVQQLCERGGVLPCVLDAAAFRYEDDPTTSKPLAGRSTKPGYVNPKGQVTVRNTGLPGTDHVQYVYQLACSHCGENYGANGTDIHDRKCPKCQGGAPGLPLSKSQAVEAK